MAWYGYAFDAFLSHAVEDKPLIADELYARLVKSGLKVWYSGKELVPGQNLSEQIKSGIERSRNGIFILSPRFMEKMWPKREYYTLLSQERSGQKIIFPILFEIRPEELLPIDPTLIDRYGINASKGMDIMVEKLVTEIKKRKRIRIARIGLFITLTLIATIPLYLLRQSLENKIPSSEIIENVIIQRVSSLESQLEIEHLPSPHNSVKVNVKEINDILGQFNKQKSHYRNEYDFSYGKTIVRSRKNVEKYLRIDPATILPGENYGPILGMLEERSDIHFRQLVYFLKNNKPVKWSISSPPTDGNASFSIIVTYTNNLRFALATLTFASTAKDTRYNKVHLYGLPSEEHFHFTRENGDWKVENID